MTYRFTYISRTCRFIRITERKIQQHQQGTQGSLKLISCKGLLKLTERTSTGHTGLLELTGRTILEFTGLLELTVHVTCFTSLLGTFETGLQATLGFTDLLGTSKAVLQRTLDSTSLLRHYKQVYMQRYISQVYQRH